MGVRLDWTRDKGWRAFECASPDNGTGTVAAYIPDTIFELPLTRTELHRAKSANHGWLVLPDISLAEFLDWIGKKGHE